MRTSEAVAGATQTLGPQATGAACCEINVRNLKGRVLGLYATHCPLAKRAVPSQPVLYVEFRNDGFLSIQAHGGRKRRPEVAGDHAQNIPDTPRCGGSPRSARCSRSAEAIGTRAAAGKATPARSARESPEEPWIGVMTARPHHKIEDLSDEQTNHPRLGVANTDLTYMSCQESGKARGLFRRLAAEMGADEKAIIRLLKGKAA
jgi:hypothetical protein